MKILLAADGSDYTKRAARELAKHVDWFAKPPEITILHVRPPFPFAGAAARVGKEAVEKYEREESLKALAVAEKELDKAGVAYDSVWVIGQVAEEIVRCAKRHAIDLIVMGSHGHGFLAKVTVGSITAKVVATAKGPVLIVS